METKQPGIALVVARPTPEAADAELAAKRI